MIKKKKCNKNKQVFSQNNTLVNELIKVRFKYIQDQKPPYILNLI